MKKILLLLLTFSSSLFTADAQSWTAAGTGLDGTVNTEVVWNDTLYIGGSFAHAGGNLVGYIAKWNGTDWEGVGGGLDGYVFALTVYNGNLVAGGQFTYSGIYNPYVAQWNGTTWSAMGGLNDQVTSFAVFNGNLVAGGFFEYDNATSQYLYNIAQWNGSSWASVGGNILNGVVGALAVYNNNLVVCGSFTTPATYVAQWNGSSWLGMGYLNKEINALTIYNGTLIAGGGFTHDNLSHTINYVAQWNGSAWAAMGQGTSSIVNSLGVYDTRLFAGTDNSPYLSEWVAQEWLDNTGAQMDAPVYAIESYHGSLFAGGSFSTAGGNSAPFIAEYHTHPLAVNNIATSGDAISIYPNPSNGVFTVKSAELKDKSTIEVYNVLGEKVFSDVIRNSQFVIDLSTFAKGIYAYRVINASGEAIATGKVITQ